MRTFNFAATIRRVFAIRNNVAAIVTGKRASSHKHSAWHASPSYRLRQAIMRFAQRALRGASMSRRGSHATRHGTFANATATVLSGNAARVCEESVERS